MSQQPRRLAVVAHFDDQGMVSDNMLALLTELRRLCAHVIIVSTNLSDTGLDQLTPFGTVLRRPNLGYDFASWRYGLEHARATLDFAELSEIVTINDSFYPLRRDVLVDAFTRMEADPADIWGLTASRQMLFHLQSYCLVFRRTAFRHRWFDAFWSAIWEYGTRDYVIMTYELAMARSASAAGLTTAALFDTNDIAAIPDHDKHLNPTHVHWRLVAHELGIAKVELIRSNPHQLDIADFPDFVEPERLAGIVAHATRPKRLPTSGQTPFDEAASFAAASPSAVAVHIHLHYPEMLDELLLAARNIPVPADIFITTTATELLPAVVARAKQHDRRSRIIPVENAGRDIWPFIQLLNAGVFERYVVVCKIHSKKSAYSVRGEEWRRALIAPLLGSSKHILDILHAFHARPDLGLVGPERSFVRDPRHWGANQPRVEQLAARIDANYEAAPVPLAFTAGSMFWFRPLALAAVRALGLRAEDFGSENGAQDGTMAHAIERLTSISTWAAGLEVSDTDRLQISFSHEGDDDSHIPVL